MHYRLSKMQLDIDGFTTFRIRVLFILMVGILMLLIVLLCVHLFTDSKLEQVRNLKYRRSGSLKSIDAPESPK